jgi:HlyD family secretion protein
MITKSKAWTTGLPIALMGLALAGCAALSGGPAPGDATTVPTVESTTTGVISEGRLVPAEFTDLSFTGGGTVAELAVGEGDQVAMGEMLARLDDSGTAQARLAAAKRSELVAQQALDDLHEKASLARGEAERDVASALEASIDANEHLEEVDTDELQDDLDDAWLDVQDAEDDLQDAQDEMDKYEGVDPDNADRKAAEDDLEEAQDAYDKARRSYDRLKNSLDSARADADTADARLEMAQSDLADLQDGPDPDLLARAEAVLDQAQAELTAAQDAVDDLSLTAPYPATVADTYLAQGEPVRPNQIVLTLADTRQWYVETTDLTEMEVVRLDAEQPVVINPDALPDLALAGEIEQIGRTYTKESGDILYTVRIRLLETDPQLRWGMTVQVTFGS